MCCQQSAEAIEDVLGFLGGAVADLGAWLAWGSGAFLFPEYDGEFVAADSCDQVVIADASAHEVGELLEDFVAAAVAVLVVVALEIIDVEKKERYGKAFYAGFFYDLSQELAEIAAVGEAGEFVGDSEALQAGVAVVQCAELGEIGREVGEETHGSRAILVSRGGQMDYFGEGGGVGFGGWP